MSTSIYIDCPAKQIKDSVPVAGASAAAELWLPLIHSMGLDILDVAFSGGLRITEEYYEGVIGQVNTVLSKFTDMPSSTPGIEDAVSRCRQLLELLKRYPPGSGCKLYLG